MSGAEQPGVRLLPTAAHPSAQVAPAAAFSVASTAARSSALGLQAALLVASVVVIGLALLLTIEPDQRTVALPLAWGGAGRLAVPEFCTSRRLWGVDCLGCGLTRSFISFAHGRLGDAWAYNPGGFVLFLAVLGQVPYRAAQLWRVARGQAAWECWLAGQALFGVLLVLMVSHWLVKHLGT